MLPIARPLQRARHSGHDLGARPTRAGRALPSSGLTRALGLAGLALLCACAALAPRPWSAATESALEQAGDGRAELERALRHYADLGEPQKLAAVEFLVQNMPGRGYARLGFLTADGVEVPFEALAYANLGEAEAAFAALEAEHGPLDYGSCERVPDVQVITAEYLIDNTERAFDAWRNTAWGRELDFDVFCEYVLPYRCSDEPLDAWRGPLMQRVAELEAQLDEGADVAQASALLEREAHGLVRFWDLYYLHPTDQGYSQMLESGAGRCEDISNMISYAHRAAAIPVASDYTPAWAHRDNNHAWNALLDGQGRGSAPVSGVAAKIYRKTYALQRDTWLDKAGPEESLPRWLARRNFIDVTDQYMPTSDVTVSLTRPAPADNRLVYLCVFNGGEWVAVHAAQVRADGTACFERVGRGLLALPAWYDGETLLPAAPPLTLERDGGVRWHSGSAGAGQALEVTTVKPETEHSDLPRAIPALHVQPGADYELFVWDDGWRSHGRLSADSEVVRFDDLPPGRLYWVVAEGGQRLERPFTLEDGRQRLW